MPMSFIDVSDHQNLKQPGLELLGSAQRLVLPERSHAGLLHQLLGFLAFSLNQPVSEGEQAVELSK
jgi:hypothetical protein